MEFSHKIRCGQGTGRQWKQFEACVLIEMCYAQTHLACEGNGKLQSDWFNYFFDQDIGLSVLC